MDRNVFFYIWEIPTRFENWSLKLAFAENLTALLHRTKNADFAPSQVALVKMIC